MRSESREFSLNREIENKKSLLELTATGNLIEVLNDFDFDWNTSSCNPKSALYSIFASNGWLDAPSKANRMGKLIYARLALHFESLDDSEGIQLGNYTVLDRVRSGKNSVIFSGKHKILGFRVVMKFIRPGASFDIIQSLATLSTGNFFGRVVMPTDILEATIPDVTGRATRVTCLVFPVVEGQTLTEFLLDESNHLNSNLVISFIKQIGSALEELERIGAYHGDLHAENILVSRSISNEIEFRLIDISFDAVGSMSLEESRNNDLDNFKHLIWRILSKQKMKIPFVSIRKFLGTKFFRKITTIISDDAESFASIMAIFRDDHQHERYLHSKQLFLNSKFVIPSSFRLQRYEEFTDPSVSTTLFVPFPQVLENINVFGNVYVSGNRGSGKSTYLASLAFFPSVEKPLVDFSEIFGIYFACRQGEFRSLTRGGGQRETTPHERILHIVILKIIRRTLELVSEGIAHKKILNPISWSNLENFLNKFVPGSGVIMIDGELVSKIDNLVTTILRLELDEVRNIERSATVSDKIATASDLISFFVVLRKTFTALERAKFHILLDDAGEPYLDKTVQSVINDLVITSNPEFCIKFSAERNTYVFRSTMGKVLENGHDYFEKDISHELFIGSGTTGINRDELEKYFRQIVEHRLVYFGYSSSDIREYLGDFQDEAGRLTWLLARGRKDAYYWGWTTVWNIADRNPRNLLEIVSDIFAAAGIERASTPFIIKMRDQSRAIRGISDKRLQSLSQIAGAFDFNGVRSSIGRKLFDVTATIGSTFHSYLVQEGRGHGRANERVRQHLAIERNDLEPLAESADFVLRKLVSFGVLDDSRSYFARDDRIRKPIYVLNRIYCPAFSIGYRRDDHLRLSKARLEQLLLKPDAFLKEGTKRLKAVNQSQIELFGYKLDGFGIE